MKGVGFVNSNMLLGLIKIEGKNVDWLLSELSKNETFLSKSSFYKKLRGVHEFSQREISAITKVLKLNQEQMMDIFFTELVS